MRAQSHWALILLLSSLTGTVWAQDATITGKASRTTSTFDVHGTFLYQALDDFSLDDTQFTHGQTQWTSARLRARYQHAFSSNVQLELGGALRANQLSGGGTDVGRQMADQVFVERRDNGAPIVEFIPRTAQVTWYTGAGRFVCGHQSAHWGLGMLVNDGAQAVDFGTGWRANLVERCSWGFRPFAGISDLAIFAAADYIYRDENADYRAGDRAYGFNAGLRFENKRTTLAIVSGYRSQKDRHDENYPETGRTTAEVLTTILHARQRLARWSRSRKLVWESEGGVIAGRTDRAYLEETYVTGADVLAMGGITRLGYESPILSTKLELGYASGDNDPRDDIIRTFQFHGSYQVGMILFDHVMPLVSARSIDRLADPDLIAVPPPSTRFTVARGGVTNSAYVHPVVTYRPVKPLELRLGYVLAQSAADASDVFQTAINGGFNTTSGGQQTGGRNWGQEIDASASYTLRNTLGQGLDVRLGGEFGTFLPGDAFTGVIDDPVTLARVTMDMAW